MIKAMGEDVGKVVTELMKTITPAKIESWTHSSPIDWANRVVEKMGRDAADETVELFLAPGVVMATN